MPEDKRKLLGPVGDTVRANVERLRTLRRLSYRELSDRLAEQGRAIPTLGLSRIERGERRVDADDLLALAVALRVSPASLLLPQLDDGEPVHLTPATARPASTAWAWLLGREPLWSPGRAPEEGPDDGGESEEFRRQLPPFRGRDPLRDHTASRAARDVAARVYTLLSQMGRESTEVRIEALQRALRRMAAEADDAIAWARQHRWEDDRGYSAGENPAEPRPVVAAIVTSSKGVLITARRDGRPPWGFVTGEVEPGERPEDAAVREVKEETGLEVRTGRLIGEREHPATGRHMIYLSARPASRSTKVAVGDAAELAEVRWVSLADVEKLLPGMFGPVRDYLASTLKG